MVCGSARMPAGCAQRPCAPNVRFPADDVKALEFPENIAGGSGNGIKETVSAFFACVHPFSIRRKGHGANHAGAYGVAPFLLPLFGKETEFPIGGAHQPAAGGHIEDFSPFKAHAVVISSCHFPQRHHGAGVLILWREHLPGRAASGDPEKGKPGGKEKEEET